MTICQHHQDKTMMMIDVPNVLFLLRFYFYNTLVINRVCLCPSVSVLLLLQCSDVYYASCFLSVF